MKKPKFYYNQTCRAGVIQTGLLVMIIGIVAGLSPPATAHTIQYQVENKGVSLRIFSGPDEPVSYSAYEIFGPSDKIPHQKGRTDKNGFVSFLPDRPGKWVVQVQEDSDHGPHGARITVEVNQNLFMESFKKPLVAQYTKALVGVSFILAIFGILALLKSKRRKNGLA